MKWSRPISLPCRTKEHLDPGLAGSGRRGNDVQVLGSQVQDLLPLVYLLDGSQLVPKGCRPLELQPVRGLCILCAIDLTTLSVLPSMKRATWSTTSRYCDLSTAPMQGPPHLLM